MNPTTVYHLVLPTWWANFNDKDFYESETLQEETFIHFSTREQVNGTLANYFKGVERILLLHIDTTKLTSKLVFEDLFNIGINFPHLYGRLNKDAVFEVQELVADANGVITLL
jgi:uncharacterized protein (DUF952 family)